MARAIVAVSAPSFRPPSFRSAEMSAPRVCAGCGLADRHEYDDAGDRRRVAHHGYEGVPYCSPDCANGWPTAISPARHLIVGPAAADPPVKKAKTAACQHLFVKSWPAGPRDNGEQLWMCRHCGAAPPEAPAAAPPAAIADAPAAAADTGASPVEEEGEDMLAMHQANLQVLNPLVLDLMKTVTKQQTEIFDLKKQVDGLEKIRKQVASLEELRKRAPPLPPFLQGDRVKLRKGTIKGISKTEGVIAGRCPSLHAQNFWTIHMPNGNAYGIHETDIIRVCTHGVI